MLPETDAATGAAVSDGPATNNDSVASSAAGQGSA